MAEASFDRPTSTEEGNAHWQRRVLRPSESEWAMWAARWDRQTIVDQCFTHVRFAYHHGCDQRNDRPNFYSPQISSSKRAK